MSIELQKYKGKDTRHECPGCNDKSSFVVNYIYKLCNTIGCIYITITMF